MTTPAFLEHVKGKHYPVAQLVLCEVDILLSRGMRLHETMVSAANKANTNSSAKTDTSSMFVTDAVASLYNELKRPKVFAYSSLVTDAVKRRVMSVLGHAPAKLLHVRQDRIL